MLMYAYTPSWILSTPIQPMYVPYTDVRDVRLPVRQAWRSARSTAYYVKVLHDVKAKKAYSAAAHFGKTMQSETGG